MNGWKQASRLSSKHDRHLINKGKVKVRHRGQNPNLILRTLITFKTTNYYHCYYDGFYDYYNDADDYYFYDYYYYYIYTRLLILQRLLRLLLLLHIYNLKTNKHNTNMAMNDGNNSMNNK